MLPCCSPSAPPPLLLRLFARVRPLSCSSWNCAVRCACSAAIRCSSSRASSSSCWRFSSCRARRHTSGAVAYGVAAPCDSFSSCILFSFACFNLCTSLPTHPARSLMVLQVMGVWSAGRKEDWFCTHIGWQPLGTATALAPLLHFLVLTCYLPSYTCGAVESKTMTVEPVQSSLLHTGSIPSYWPEHGLQSSAKLVQTLLTRLTVLEEGSACSLHPTLCQLQWAPITTSHPPLACQRHVTCWITSSYPA